MKLIRKALDTNGQHLGIDVNLNDTPAELAIQQIDELVENRFFDYEDIKKVSFEDNKLEIESADEEVFSTGTYVVQEGQLMKSETKIKAEDAKVLVKRKAVKETKAKDEEEPKAEDETDELVDLSKEDIILIKEMFARFKREIPVFEYEEVFEDEVNMLKVECDNSNPTYISWMNDALRVLEEKHNIGSEQESNDNGFYGRTYTFYKFKSLKAKDETDELVTYLVRVNSVDHEGEFSITYDDEFTVEAPAGLTAEELLEWINGSDSPIEERINLQSDTKDWAEIVTTEVDLEIVPRAEDDIDDIAGVLKGLGYEFKEHIDDEDIFENEEGREIRVTDAFEIYQVVEGEELELDENQEAALESLLSDTKAEDAPADNLYWSAEPVASVEIGDIVSSFRSIIPRGVTKVNVGDDSVRLTWTTAGNSYTGSYDIEDKIDVLYYRDSKTRVKHNENKYSEYDEIIRL